MNEKKEWRPYLTDEEIEKIQRGWEKYVVKEDPYDDPDEFLYTDRLKQCTGIPERITKLRSAFGWNKMKLSDYVECSEMHVRYLENGKRRPSYKMLVKLAKAFGIERDALLDEEAFQKAHAEVCDRLAGNK